MSAEDLDGAMSDRMLELRPKLRWRHVAERADMDVANLRRIRHGEIALTKHAAASIDDALNWQRGTAWAYYYDDPQPGAAPRQEDQADDRPLPSVRPEDYPSGEDEGDGWTAADEAFYKALVELLRRQGLKPTPAIIQAMREEWEREQAELAERGESDETG